MTMTMTSLMSERQQQPAGGNPKEHSGLLAMPTREIKLSPEFVQALQKVAPKGRKRVLRYVLLLAVVVAGGSLAVVPEARHRIASAWQRAWHGGSNAASVAPVASAPTQPSSSSDAVTAGPSAAVSAPAIVIPPVVISSAAPDTSSSSTKPSKPPKRWQRQSPR